jgi:hypothetical protein
MNTYSELGYDQYPQDVQRFLISYLISDHDIFRKCKGVIKPDLFDDKLKRAVRFILNHEAEFGALPPSILVRAKSSVELKTLAELNLDASMNEKWFLQEFENFCRHRTMENTSLDAFELMRNGQYQELTDQISAAMKISISGRKHKFDRTSLLDGLARPLPKWLFAGLCRERSVGVIFGRPEVSAIRRICLCL